MRKRISATAIKINQNGFVFYSTVIDSDILKNTCFLSRREDDPKKGFQRLLNISRARAIAKYLDGKEGAIPTALILSAQSSANLKYNRKGERITFDTADKAFLVLDGQHRLYGLKEAKKVYQIPVVIFKDLDLTNEVKYFVDINTTQKGVPTALILDIKQLAGTETTIETRLRNIFDALNKDKESPLIGLMSPSRSQTGKISRVTFNLSLKSILDNGILSNVTNDIAVKAVINYLKAAEKVLSDSRAVNAKLYKALFFQAFFAIFEDIATRAIREHSNLKYESFLKEMEQLANVNYDNFSGSSKVTISNLIKEMKKQQKAVPITEEML